MDQRGLPEVFRLYPGSVVAFCGGGVATGLLYKMAEEAAARGWRILCSSTVSAQKPPAVPGRALVLASEVSNLETHLRATFASLPQVVLLAGAERKDKYIGMPEETLRALSAAGLADLILLQTDGARGRPFKAPNPDEPLIPDFATHVVVVVGMEVVGRPLEERLVHRPERVEALAGLAPGGLVTPEVIARTLSAPEGYLSKTPPGARCFVYCAKANTIKRQRAAARLAELLEPAPVEVVPSG